MGEIKSTQLVTPIGDFNCQSFPLVEGNVYEITDEELEALGRHELKWSTKNGKPILVENDPSDESARKAALQRIAELKALLANSDYQAIKYAEGEMSASEYAPMKANRQAWRAEINELEKSL